MGHLYTLGKSLDIPRFVMTLKYIKGKPFSVTLRDQMMNMRHSDGSDILVDLENSDANDITKQVLDDMIVMVNDKLVELNRLERNSCLLIGISQKECFENSNDIEITKGIAEKYDISCSAQTSKNSLSDFFDREVSKELNKLMAVLG